MVFRYKGGYSNPKLDILNQNAKDLVRKKLVPEHTLNFFNPNRFQTHYANWQISGIKRWKCKKCGIYIHGPRDWIVQHVKSHFNKEQRENEIDEVHVNIY